MRASGPAPDTGLGLACKHVLRISPRPLQAWGLQCALGQAPSGLFSPLKILQMSPVGHISSVTL